MSAFLLVFALTLGCNKNRDVDTAEIAFGDLDGDGYSIADGDCNDERPDMRPEGSEVCDGLDNDCDGEVDENTANTWYIDGDGDGDGAGEGIGSCVQPGNYVPIAGDCDDEDPEVRPGASEECDGVDDDCDGQVDNGVLSAFFSDSDADGYGDPSAPIEGCEAPEGAVDNDFDCDDEDPAINPVALDVCNEVDDDCDGDLDEDPDIGWYYDKDGDGYGGGEAQVFSCEQQDGLTSEGGDSDDYDNSVSPGADELCDGIDNDSDGEIDEGDAVDASVWYVDADGDGYGNEDVSVTACSQPSGYVAITGDTDDASTKVNPGQEEVCDGVDNDSDGQVDESDAIDAQLYTVDNDGDGYGDSSGSGVYACSTPSGYAQGTDCDDSDAAINPGATETCDGVDEDCDGTIDDNPSNGSTFYQDWDSDSFGNISVTIQACSVPSGYSADHTDCDDTVASTYPGADEYCDGDDDDCDGTIDNDPVDSQAWYYDSDGDGYGSSTLTTTACNQPSGYASVGGDCDDGNANVSPGASEVCDTVDNDCDGATDEADATNAGSWYRDLDKDGFGNSSKSTSSCNQPSGYVSDKTDCDDTDANAHPGGTEVCDGVDNDCDGNKDWGLSVGVDYSTIQDAIDDATDGDEICVPAGTYLETIDFGGKRILLEGEGAGVTFIDGNGSGPVVTFDSGETAVSTLTGFTITGGKANKGAGIYIDGADPTLEDLVVEFNTCSSSSSTCYGTGVFAYDSDSLLSDLVIEDNTATGSGGCQGLGLFVAYGSVTVEGTTIDDNDGACTTAVGLGVRVSTDGELLMSDSTISNNTASSATYYDNANWQGVGLDSSGAVGVELDNVTIEGNGGSASVYYNGTFRGAGLNIRSVPATLTDVTIQGNYFTVQSVSSSSIMQGAGLYLYGDVPMELTRVDVLENILTTKQNGTIHGAGAVVHDVDPTVDDLLVWGNALKDSTSGVYSMLGAGMMLYDAAGTWDHVWVAENTSVGARNYAGGIYFVGVDTVPVFDNLIVSGNALTGESGSSNSYGAGLMSNSYASPVITNADVVGNTCATGTCYGGGLLLWDWGGADVQNTNIVSNVAGSSGGAVYVWNASKLYFLDFDYTNFYDNGSSAFANTTDPSGSDGNIAVDPDYTDVSSSGDSVDWDLTLATGSSCIDAGDPSILDTDSSVSDIGAYGGPGGAW